MLEISDLTTGYGTARALSGVSLRVERGEAMAILGANGAGKTTLMRAISGLLRPWEGRVMLDGHDVSALPAEERSARGIALSPEGRGILTTLTVEENLVLGIGPLARREGRRSAKKQLPDALEEMYAMFPILKERRHTSGGMLSGGQQQMLCIARALMSKPDLLLLDEPSLGLAPQIIQSIYGVFGMLRERGQTMVVVEESSARALAFSDRACALRVGEVFLQGSAQEVQHSPELVEAYLGADAIGGSRL